MKRMLFLLGLILSPSLFASNERMIETLEEHGREKYVAKECIYDAMIELKRGYGDTAYYIINKYVGEYNGVESHGIHFGTMSSGVYYNDLTCIYLDTNSSKSPEITNARQNYERECMLFNSKINGQACNFTTTQNVETAFKTLCDTILEKNIILGATCGDVCDPREDTPKTHEILESAANFLRENFLRYRDSYNNSIKSRIDTINNSLEHNNVFDKKDYFIHHINNLTQYEDGNFTKFAYDLSYWSSTHNYRSQMLLYKDITSIQESFIRNICPEKLSECLSDGVTLQKLLVELSNLNIAGTEKRIALQLLELHIELLKKIIKVSQLSKDKSFSDISDLLENLKLN